MFYLISTDREMGLLLVLFGCAAVVRRCGGPIILGDSSRFGEFNSRLHRREFPVRVATGICWQGLICLTVFAAEWRLPEENRRNSRLAGKNREFCPWPSERAVAQLHDNGADLGCLGPIVRLVANRGVQPFASDEVPGTGPQPAARATCTA